MASAVKSLALVTVVPLLLPPSYPLSAKSSTFAPTMPPHPLPLPLSTTPLLMDAQPAMPSPPLTSPSPCASLSQPLALSSASFLMTSHPTPFRWVVVPWPSFSPELTPTSSNSSATGAQTKCSRVPPPSSPTCHVQLHLAHAPRG